MSRLKQLKMFAFRLFNDDAHTPFRIESEQIGVSDIIYNICILIIIRHKITS